MSVDLKEKLSIVAIVKFNDKHAYVLNREPEFTYTKNGSVIYGRDEGIFQCYEYGACGNNWKAFGGAKFSIALDDGTTEECYGQWWHGGYSKIAELNNVEIHSFTTSTLGALQKCYVFTGHEIEKDFLNTLITDYNERIGTVYEYRDYEKVIKYDDMLSSQVNRRIEAERKLEKEIKKLRKAKSSLVIEVKRAHAELRRLNNDCTIQNN